MWEQKQILDFLKKEYPAIFQWPMKLYINEIEQNSITIKAKLEEHAFRPIKIVSGPTIMSIADLTLYALLLARDHEKARFSVTTSLNINFITALKTEHIMAKGTILKYGKTLINGEVRITNAEKPNFINPDAHIALTYYNDAK